MTIRSIAAGATIAAMLLACGRSTPVDGQLRFERFVVKDPQVSAAFLDVIDMNGDGVMEIVLSTLLERNVGPPSPDTRGALRIFESSTGTLEGPWNEHIIITPDDNNNGEGWGWINTPQVMDVDGDGIRDILVQTGFLLTAGGAHFFMRGTSNETLDFPHTQRVYFSTETRQQTSDNYWWHESAQVDFDGDGHIDLVTTSAQTQRVPQNPTGTVACDKEAQPNGRCAELKVEWYRNTGTNGPDGLPAFEYYQIAPEHNVGGVFLKLRDLDRDGDQDIVMSQFFGPPEEPSIVWLEQVTAPSPENGYAGEWALHEIDHTIGYGYHMEFVDLDGDGRDDLVVGNHNNQDDPNLQDANGNLVIPPGLYWFEIPDNPKSVSQWTRHAVSETFRVTLDYGSTPQSQGVPGIFNVGDINNDGMLDIATPGDGNDALYAHLQIAPGVFEEVVVDRGKTHGMAMVRDVDGDGLNEIVAAMHNSLDGEQTVDFPPGRLSIYRYRR